jgi:hypothetical protein
MSISLKYTELGFTKTGRKMILEENQYNYQEDTWTMIKQFMIVPTTAPAYNNYQLKKALKTAGIDVMKSIYKRQFGKGFTNMNESSIPLDKRRNLLSTSIMKQVIISENKNHAKYIMDLWFKSPEIKKKEKEVKKETERLKKETERLRMEAASLQSHQRHLNITNYTKKFNSLSDNKKTIIYNNYYQDHVDIRDSLIRRNEANQIEMHKSLAGLRNRFPNVQGVIADNSVTFGSFVFQFSFNSPIYNSVEEYATPLNTSRMLAGARCWRMIDDANL